MLKSALPLSLLLSVSAFANTQVVTTVKPVSLIVGAIGGEHVTVEQLINNQASPHDFALRPSDLRKLNDAELVVWVGESLETFLEKPLANLNAKKDLEWMALNGLTLREFGEEHDHEGHEHEDHEGHDHEDHEGHEHEDHEGHDLEDHEGHEHEDHEGHDHEDHEGHDHEDHEGHDHEDHEGHDHEDHEGHDHHGHSHTGTDPHVWLDPENAKVLAHAVADRLAALDPDNAEAFEANYATFVNDLEQADKRLAAQLKPIHDVPYFVFHEAYGYFEAHYGLNNQGAVTVSPERKPGAQTVAKLREEIEEHKVECIFSEPQFSPGIVKTLIAGTDVKSAVLDPLGSTYQVDTYGAFLEELGNQYLSCLK